MTNFINVYHIEILSITSSWTWFRIYLYLTKLEGYRFIKVIPIWIYGFYNIYLPFSMPVFKLLLSFDRLPDIIKCFIVYKPFTIVLRCKTIWINHIFMLIYSFHKIRCNSDIETSSFPICSYVYKSSFHNTEVVDPESSSGWQILWYTMDEYIIILMKIRAFQFSLNHKITQ